MLQPSAAEPQPIAVSLDYSPLSTRSQVFEHYVGRTLLSVSPRSTDKSVRPTFFDSARKHVSGYLAGGLARRFLSVARRLWATGKRRNRFCYMALYFEQEEL